MSQINCQFSAPINLLISPKEDFEFSEMICQIENPIAVALENPDIYELIENPEYPREFFVEKTFSYGDAIVIWFLTLFLIFLIAKTIFNFFWGK